jgi:hypothetical protein
MTDEIKEELLAFGAKYYTIPKNTWNEEELKAVYAMYNKIHSTTKVDQGCNSCRRTVITDVRDQFSLVRRQTLPGSTF